MGGGKGEAVAETRGRGWRGEGERAINGTDFAT